MSTATEESSGLVLAVRVGDGPDPREEMEYERPYPGIGEGYCSNCRGAARVPRRDLVVIRKATEREGGELGFLVSKCPKHLDVWRSYHEERGMSRTSRAGIRRRCACGCGELTARTWVQGHDTKALHAALRALGCVDPVTGESDVAAFVSAVANGQIVAAP